MFVRSSFNLLPISSLWRRHRHEETTAQKVLAVANKVCLLALALFSTSVRVKLFVPFFLLGVGVGAYSGYPHAHEHRHGTCAQGFLEQLSGVELPAAWSLAANVIVTVCHIDHHPAAFVPIVAGVFGVSVGAAILPTCDWCYRKIALLNG